MLQLSKIKPASLNMHGYHIHVFFPLKISSTHLVQIKYCKKAPPAGAKISDCKHLGIDVTVTLINISQLIFDVQQRAVLLQLAGTYSSVFCDHTGIDFRLKCLFRVPCVFPERRGPSSTSHLPVGCTLSLSSPSTLPPR